VNPILDPVVTIAPSSYAARIRRSAVAGLGNLPSEVFATLFSTVSLVTVPDPPLIRSLFDRVHAETKIPVVLPCERIEGHLARGVMVPAALSIYSSFSRFVVHRPLLGAPDP
jgi:hypothetical protein